MLRLGFKRLLRELNHLAVIRAHKTGWAEQIGLAQTALVHFRCVVLKAEVRPNKVKRAMAVRLYVARGHAVDLLLKNHAGEQRHHDGARHLVAQPPPVLGHDVQKARVMKLHAFFEAAHLRDLRCSTCAAAGRDHGGVAVVRVHAQLAFVVGSPKAKGNKPGVQQTGVIGVLDVLLHQLPVARDALAVVAQHLELAAVEQAVEVGEDGWPHEILQRLHAVVKRRKHHAATGGDFQGGEAMVFGVKVGRHATVDLAVLANPAPKWHALQIAFEVVTPLVIGADKLFFMAMAFATKLHAPMGANVFDHVNLPLVVTRHDDRALTHHRAFEITCKGDFSLETHIAPMVLIKETLQLLFVAVFIGVDGKRDTASAACFPVNGLLAHGVSWLLMPQI